MGSKLFALGLTIVMFFAHAWVFLPGIWAGVIVMGVGVFMEFQNQ